MDKENIDRIMKKVRMKIAVSKFEDGEHKMPKRNLLKLVATFVLTIGMTFGLVYAGNTVYEKIWKEPEAFKINQGITEEEKAQCITEEEAEEYAKYLKALEKYRHNFTIDELKNPYTPKYQLHLYRDKIEYIGYGTVKGKIWFKSSKDCDLFIREVGIDNIKKFMFDIWE